MSLSRGDCHTQTIEGFWAQLKRGINGTHIHMSSKHLPKYLGKFEYRWNMRDVPHLMLDRMLRSFTRVNRVRMGQNAILSHYMAVWRNVGVVLGVVSNV